MSKYGVISDLYFSILVLNTEFTPQIFVFSLNAGKYRLEKTPSLDTSPAAKGQTNIELRMGVLRANFSASSCPAANSLIIQVDFVVTII